MNFGTNKTRVWVPSRPFSICVTWGNLPILFPLSSYSQVGCVALTSQGYSVRIKLDNVCRKLLVHSRGSTNGNNYDRITVLITHQGQIAVTWPNTLLCNELCSYLACLCHTEMVVRSLTKSHNSVPKVLNLESTDGFWGRSRTMNSLKLLAKFWGYVSGNRVHSSHQLSQCSIVQKRQRASATNKLTVLWVQIYLSMYRAFCV